MRCAATVLRRSDSIRHWGPGAWSSDDSRQCRRRVRDGRNVCRQHHATHVRILNRILMIPPRD